MLDNKFTAAGWRQAHKKGAHTYDDVEVWLKGPEVLLPYSASFHDKDGTERHHVGLRGWDSERKTYQTAVLGMEGREHELPDDLVATISIMETRCR